MASTTHLPPARLVIQNGTDAGMKHAVTERVEIGRSEGTLLLRDNNVSRRHASIYATDAGWMLEDLDSANGTTVNGQGVSKCVLEFGDEIGLASTMLSFEQFDPVEEEIIARQRLEMLGRIGTGVVHEVNNVLSVISGNVEFLRSALMTGTFKPADATETLDDIVSAVEQAAALTPRLSQILRPVSRDASVNVTAVCFDVIRLIEKTFPRGIGIESKVGDQLFTRGDASDLHLALMNVCLLARDGLEGRSGTISVVAKRQTKRTLGKSAAALRGDMGIVVTVHDDGRSRDASQIARLFDPILLPEQLELGLHNLHITRQRLEAQGGFLLVDSPSGEGTRYRIVLPTARPAKTTNIDVKTLKTSILPPSSGIPASIDLMIVDDDSMIRRTFARLLKRHGFRIRQAADGVEGLKLCAERPPDLILLDLDMPNMGGEEMNAVVRERYPDARVVVVTGHHDPMRERRLLIAGVVQILHKPVLHDDLFAAIHDSAETVDVDRDDDAAAAPADGVTARHDFSKLRGPPSNP
jgi:CheY-like chemotaxis protein/nitrogen-specific signal transduction histidine kinase